MTYQRAPESCSSDCVKARSVCVDSTVGRGPGGTSARRGGALAERLTATGGRTVARAAAGGGVGDGGTGRRIMSTESERTGIESATGTVATGTVAAGTGCGRDADVWGAAAG